MAAPLITGLDADARVEAVIRQGIVYLTNGYDRARKRYLLDGVVTVHNLGIEPLRKTDDLTLAAIAGGAMTAGTYAGCITRYNGRDPIFLESNPSTIETVVVAAPNLQIRFAWNPAGWDAQVTHVRCYLTLPGVAASWDSMFYVGEAAVATGQLDINLSEAQIGAGAVLSQANNAPAGRYKHICAHKGGLVLANRSRSPVATGTADAGSGIGTLVDTEIEDYEADYLLNMLVVVREGTATEERREITGYTPATGTITFANLTTLVGVGDAYTVYERAAPTEVVWSPADNAETFPIENTVVIDTGEMDEVTAVASFGDVVVAFGRNRYARVNTTLARYAMAGSSVGTRSPASIVRIGGTLWWYAEAGVHMMGLDFSPRCMTDKLKQDFTRRINQRYAEGICACYFDRAYHIAYPVREAQKNDGYHYYSLLTGGWFRREYPFHVQALAEVHDEYGMPRLFAGAAAGDPGPKIKMLELGVNDLASDDAAENTGTATGGSTTTCADTGQAWTVDEFVGAPVRVVKPSGARADSVVTGNTADTLTFGAMGLTVEAGDTYVLGFFESRLETAEFDFGRPHEKKRLYWVHAMVEDELDDDSAFEVGAYADGEPQPFRTTQVTKNADLAKVYMPARAERFALHFLDMSADSPGKLLGLVAEAEGVRGPS